MTNTYLSEIHEQPAILEKIAANYQPGPITELAEAISNGHFRRIVLTGMGSSLHGTIPLRLTLMHATDTPVESWEASELLHYGPHVVDHKTLMIAVSQSGESAEVVNLLKAGIQPATLISVTNGPDNTLANAADISLITHAGDEASVSTKTYTSTLAILHLLGQQLTGKDLSTAKDAILRIAANMQNLLANHQEITNQLGEFLGKRETLAFIGRGYSMATVYTAALITQESSKVFTKGYTGGEFRHGPIELVREGFCAVIFLGADHTRGLNERLATEIAQLGGQVVLIGPEPPSNTMSIALPPTDPQQLPMLSIIPAQLMTIPLARANGFEPATFQNATKITRSE